MRDSPWFETESVLYALVTLVQYGVTVRMRIGTFWRTRLTTSRRRIRHLSSVPWWVVRNRPFRRANERVNMGRVWESQSRRNDREPGRIVDTPDFPINQVAFALFLVKLRGQTLCLAIAAECLFSKSPACSRGVWDVFPKLA